MLCTSGFVDDVMSHVVAGHIGLLKVIHQEAERQNWERSLMHTVALFILKLGPRVLRRLDFVYPIYVKSIKNWWSFSTKLIG